MPISGPERHEFLAVIVRSLSVTVLRFGQGLRAAGLQIVQGVESVTLNNKSNYYAQSNAYAHSLLV